MKAVIYLLQVFACSAIFYLFYFLLLRRLTFFTINRWYLLGILLLSFCYSNYAFAGGRKSARCSFATGG